VSAEIVSVAVPAPLHQQFDYAVPESLHGRLRPGMRVRVPFGRRRVVGIVAAAPREDAGRERLRLVEALLDDEPLLPAELMGLCRWAADYYRHPLGEVLQAALPPGLRGGDPPTLRQRKVLRLTAAGTAARTTLPARNRAQRALLDRLAAGALDESEARGAGALKLAGANGWVEWIAAEAGARTVASGPALTAEQAAALEQLPPLGSFGVALLEGVTGSGKTEMYLRRIAEVLAAGRQALVLVPEIGLTPQLVDRFSERFGAGVAAFHSAAGERARREAWLGARAGTVPVVVGTRSAIFVPFARLGIIVVDEEHDVSYKQQEGFRYSARDLALVRAQRNRVPVILGSATPALETLHNAALGRYRRVRLAQRVSGAAPPRVRLLDVRGQRLEHGLDGGGQVLLFQNRRGFAPVLMCHACGWTASCVNCDARPTLHRARGLLICHHCSKSQDAPVECPSCRARPLLALGQGTERIEDALKNQFPGKRIERFDSDRLTKRGELERLLDDVASGAVHVLVGTQILAKGHDFANVTLVGIVSADQALYGTDFRAVERMGQVVTQVAGRAGRATRPGEVLMQTHEPDHPLLQALLGRGYAALAEELLTERKMAGLPPFAHLALLRAEALEAELPMRFLASVRALALETASAVRVFEPVPAPMERRAGRFRAQLLLQAATRGVLQQRLGEWVPKLERLPLARRVRWSLDVDPADLY
jgi:primosomal protein N' (replication factor Y)